MPNHAHFLVHSGGSYTQNLILIILTPKGTSLGENASFETSTVKIHPGVRPGRVPEKKSKQDRTTKKKAQQRYISQMWGNIALHYIEKLHIL